MVDPRRKPRREIVNVKLQVLVTAAEATALRAAARASGQTLSAWARAALMAAVK